MFNTAIGHNPESVPSISKMSMHNFFLLLETIMTQIINQLTNFAENDV
jgi:hypothetical protein